MNILQAHLQKNTPNDKDFVYISSDGFDWRKIHIPYDQASYFWLPKSTVQPAYDFQILMIYRFRYHFFQVLRMHFQTKYEDVPTTYNLNDKRTTFLQERMLSQTGIAALWDTKESTSLAHIMADRRIVPQQKTDCEYWVKQFYTMLFLHQRKDDRIESLFQELAPVMLNF